MAENTEKYLYAFIQETDDKSEDIESILLELENDLGNIELINELFRSIHTVKGSAGTMASMIAGENAEYLKKNLIAMTEIMHVTEDILSDVKNGSFGLEQKHMNLLFSVLDKFNLYKLYISENKTETVDHNAFVSELINARNTSKLQSDNQSFVNIMPPKEQLAGAHSLTIEPKDQSEMKSVSSFIIVNDIMAFGEVIYCDPSVNALKTGAVFDKLNVFIKPYEQYTIDYILEKLISYRSILSATLNETNISDVANPNEQTTGEIMNLNRNVSSKTIKVSVSILDTLINLVGELIINKNRLNDFLARSGTVFSDTDSFNELTEISSSVENIAAYLQNETMQARMLPIDTLFARFPRMVRDLAQNLNKEIHVELVGKETVLDRSIIEQLFDPLVHLVRNSIDHGVETPAEREAIGKSQTGFIKMSARQEQGLIVIIIEDDGKGIDLAQLAKSAIEKNVITPEKLEKMSEKDILNLIFKPGFSTAKKISEVSGRGVGMDVVRTKLLELNGSIDVIPIPNKGTKTTIKLPLTLAIIKALTVHICDEVYAFPMSSVSECITIESKDIRTISEKGEIYYFRGITLPIVRLRKFYGLPELRKENEKLAIINIGERKVGFVVDAFVDQQDIVIKSLGDYIGSIPGISGAYILGNGDIGLIIDIQNIFNSFDLY